MNILLPLMFPAQFGCFSSSEVTMILVGKAAIIDFMFFYHHSTDTWFANGSPASNRFAVVWSKLLTEDDGNLPLDFVKVSDLKCPSTEEVKKTPCTVPWKSWPSQIRRMGLFVLVLLLHHQWSAHKDSETLYSYSQRSPGGPCDPLASVWDHPLNTTRKLYTMSHRSTSFHLSGLIQPWVCWRQSDRMRFPAHRVSTACICSAVAHRGTGSHH